ncbi:hypothetical protein BDN70DRAFT_880057, partial [Pholiota conissans]
MCGPPILPPELERKIFELVVEEHPKSALPVMLVAARTHYWVASILYNVSNQLGRTYPPVRGSNPNVKYYGTYVKHLIIGGDKSFEGLCRYLSACPNLIDIAIWTNCSMKRFLGLFSDLKLERLSASLISLSPADFRSAAFAHLTHLDATKCGAKWAQCQGFVFLPHLTHLAINDMIDIDTLRQLLQRCERLKILLAINRGGSWYGWDCDWDSRRDIIMDPRFVMMKIVRYVIGDWMNSAHGKPNMWDWAEAISSVKKKESYKDGGKLWTTWFDEITWEGELSKACEQNSGLS